LKFRRQHPIGPCFADFVCIEQRLVIELDGWSHEATVEYDIRRQSHIEPPVSGSSASATMT
jgi:very-short-patch-repair endonuclease